jgi:hypothetical protein
VVPGIAVKEAEQVATHRGVMLVDIGVVDAHPPLVRVLADEDGIGEPLRVENFADEADCE